MGTYTVSGCIELNRPSILLLSTFHEHKARFPKASGYWLFGSIESGQNHVNEELACGKDECLSIQVRTILGELERMYQEAKALRTRFQSHSDPISEAEVKLSDDRKLKALAISITNIELSLISAKGQAVLEKARLDISEQLDSLLAEAAVVQFYAHYGYYLSILNAELKNDNILEHLHFRKPTIKSTQGLVAQVDTEAIAKKADPNAHTPVTDSINKAHEFVQDVFPEPADIFQVFRAYAEQNHRFHTGVKELADGAKFTDLRDALVQDKLSLKSLGLPTDMQEIATKTLDQVWKKFFLPEFFSWTFTDKDFILTEYGSRRLKARKASEKGEKGETGEKGEKGEKEAKI